MPRVHDSSIVLTDPVPAPGPWELEQLGSVEAWTDHILMRREQRIKKRARDQELRSRGITQWADVSVRPVSDWKSIIGDFNQLIHHRLNELNQLKTLMQLIEYQVEEAE